MDDKAHEMPEVYQSVNAQQNTAFKINIKVYQVANTVFHNGSVVGKLPSTENIPLPPKPFDIATNEEAKTKWKRKAAKVYSDNAELKSKRLLIDKILWVAEEYDQYPEHYYPMQYDFRGRIYCVPMFLNFQGNDLSKSLLLFSNGKPIGSDEALNKLAIHGANMYGEDKRTLADRVKWVQENEEAILASAKDPHNNYDFWARISCSEPYQFLAFCFEWEEFVDSGRDLNFITHLPCYSDCTNSGLQIFSGMLRDEIGGKATNLTNEDKPQDVYGEVANRTLKHLKEMPDSQLKKMWSDYGITRKTTKKVTMCVVYGLTKYKSRNYLQEHLEDMVAEGKPCPFAKDKDESELTGTPSIYEATLYITLLIWKSIGEIIISAKECMKWLQEVSKLVSDNGLKLTFTTPTNYIVQLNYMQMKKQRVNTRMGESMKTKKITIQYESEKIDKGDVANAIAPCFVHAIDGSILAKAVSKASSQGIKSFACVHDAFGVLACDSQLMNDCVRESFVEIFTKENVLENFCKEITPQIAKNKQHLIPKLPKMRNLNISEVLKSEYFCS